MHKGNLRKQLFAELASSLDSPDDDFRQYVDKVFPGYRWGVHHLLIAEHLERLARGEIRRLMIFAPPRHGKSELVSRLYPGWYLSRHPQNWVGLSSYSATLSTRLSRSARQYYYTWFQGGRQNSLDVTRSASNWETASRGGMWSSGSGGSQTGLGFNLGIIDDPVKNLQDARSPAIQQKLREWWTSTFATRAQKDASIVLIQTRWTEEDLGGWLLSRERQSDEGTEGWTVISLPAMQVSAASHDIPESCELILDDRKPGEPLWPLEFPLRSLRKIKARDERDWQALYQCQPVETIGQDRVVSGFGDHNLAPLDFDRDLTLCVGMDFNVSPMSLAIGHIVAGQIQVVKTHEIYDSHTREACEWIRDNFSAWKREPTINTRGGWDIDIFPDPTGRARKTSAGGKTDFSIIESFGFRINAPSRPPLVRDKINGLIEASRPRDGLPLLLINSRGDMCRSAKLSLQRWSYKPGSSEPIKGGNPDYSHMVDAISFLVQSTNPVKSVAAGFIPLGVGGVRV